MTRTCPVCRRPELRQHRHRPTLVAEVRYARWREAEHRRWIRYLFSQARRGA